MKTVLCFGDSNTQGLRPDGTRFPKHKRWPGVMLEHLGKDYEVIEEGLKGRTTTLDDPIEGKSKNGRRYLKPCLESHAPLDLVIVMLGTCEMKNRYGLGASDIALGMERLLKVIDTEVLLLSPIPFGSGIEKNPLYGSAKNLPQEVAILYEELAKKREIAFLNTSKFVQANASDSLHLDEEGHRKLGTAVAAMVATLLET
jgi:lysophospholipase L1-like esterase